ncbi:hypothetical protein [Liquorilactobacillus capillatus]|uniref:Uncharacterized protein n=1 Tax=Liquorilactobacillus capillatus DSM 19910 TaxID=1423731 RepID=A0A0R1MBT1_9LACO|nr:hypothetical protein [Liquorilactobacillus capillatus]KRL02378.1 hypothetical protein FC81_GL000721 [Liquorilactobacillus capillatus DSM 19910]
MNINTKKTIANLDIIGSIIMIVSLFVGNFYAGDPGGGLVYSLSYPGYKLIFNSDYMLGTLFIIVPALILVVDRIKSLQQYESLLKFGLPIVSLIFLFVLKGQLGDTGNFGGSSSFALGAWLFLLGNVLVLVSGAARFFHIDLEQKITDITKQSRSKK